MADQDEEPDYALEYLLGYDGLIHWLNNGYFLKFEIRRVDPEELRPHGVRYSLSLHDASGKRILGFDNAHPVKHPGRAGRRAKTADHWHRTGSDEGRPYSYRGADKLLEDFFVEVRRVLAERGVSEEVVSVEDRRSDETED